MLLFEGGGNLRKSDPVEEASSFFARVDFVRGEGQHGMRKMGQPCCGCFSTMPFCPTTVWKQQSQGTMELPETMSPDIFVQLW